jgi:phosphoglycerate kinase
MQIKSVTEADVAGKRVLLRVDYNVPLQEGVVMDDSRIRATLPTIDLLRSREAAKIILATHVGRPDGIVVDALKTAPIFAHLQTLTDTTGIEMLENLRFNPGEESNDPAFAQSLAAQADVFVNDAFADSHRAHASIVGVAKLLPAYAGLLMEREITKLSAALTPQKPSLAIVGGVKLETKLPLIEKLSQLYDKVLVGGALANELHNPAPNVFLPEDGIPQLEGMFDIGPKTEGAWVAEVKKAAFVLWNGPVGWYEKGYGEATYALAQALVDSGVRAVIGGGDTEAAVAKFAFDPEKVFVSTGGGATLEFLTAGTLPGIEVLRG